MNEKEEVELKLKELFEARDMFFKELDKQVPKLPNSDVLDFEGDLKPDLKALYAKFYDYDYKIRRLMPNIYKTFGIKI